MCHVVGMRCQNHGWFWKVDCKNPFGLNRSKIESWERGTNSPPPSPASVSRWIDDIDTTTKGATHARVIPPLRRSWPHKRCRNRERVTSTGRGAVQPRRPSTDSPPFHSEQGKTNPRPHATHWIDREREQSSHAVSRRRVPATGERRCGGAVERSPPPVGQARVDAALKKGARPAKGEKQEQTSEHSR